MTHRPIIGSVMLPQPCTEYLCYHSIFQDMTHRQISGPVMLPQPVPVGQVWEWRCWRIICMPLEAKMAFHVLML